MPEAASREAIENAKQLFGSQEKAEEKNKGRGSDNSDGRKLDVLRYLNHYGMEDRTMGRGLSPLQREILLLADKNERFGESFYVSIRQVLISVYGFPYKGQGKVVFNRKIIGLNRYKAATVAVSKSMDRLSERGLVNRVPLKGIYLTRKGARAAQSLKTEEKALPPEK